MFDKAKFFDNFGLNLFILFLLTDILIEILLLIIFDNLSLFVLDKSESNLFFLIKFVLYVLCNSLLILL